MRYITIINNKGKEMIELIVRSFGFNGVGDFVSSSFHMKMLMVTIPISLGAGVVEYLFGLKSITLIAFVSLLGLELFSGIIASVFVRKEKLSSVKFYRFVLQLGMWVIILFIVNAFEHQYEAGSIMSGVYSYIHNAVMMFVNLGYLISSLENMGSMSGKSTSPLIRAILKKVSPYIDIEGLEKQKLNKDGKKQK